MAAILRFFRLQELQYYIFIYFVFMKCTFHVLACHLVIGFCLVPMSEFSWLCSKYVKASRALHLLSSLYVFISPLFTFVHALDSGTGNRKIDWERERKREKFNQCFKFTREWLKLRSECVKTGRGCNETKTQRQKVKHIQIQQTTWQPFHAKSSCTWNTVSLKQKHPSGSVL